MNGLVFNLQHYAVHDGPGIRTLVFLKGCPLRCAWCCNPESQHAQRELRLISARCRGCRRCLEACPHGAIVEEDGRPRVCRERCRVCENAACVRTCLESAWADVGTVMTTDDVVAQVAADLPFYRNSGGGVTFSGGEPFAQAPFLLELLQECRERGIHTAVETCGHAPAETLASAWPLVDLWLFDLKILDPGRHREQTGADNARILSNLRWLAACDPSRVVVRFPVVPGCTDDRTNVEAVATLVLELGLTRLDLEPYHPLGRSKYEELGRPSPIDPPVPAVSDLRAVATIFRAAGLSCDLA
ncbi:MAG TPA: glycyl-radical enzyme activating protein [Thermoanaerobaculaceae bacterium]|nr:glycyl-radical enzyme activating protein [Thermoanaerobaculaceae bacterium]HPS78223.1 glycyl-radical enzyme activating protein [Thermoanaerobaculaceae bacterium]